MDCATRDSNTAAAWINLLLQDYMGFCQSGLIEIHVALHVRRLVTFIQLFPKTVTQSYTEQSKAHSVNVIIIN